MLGSVVRRGNRYAVCVYAGIDPVTKKQRQKWYSGFETRKDAEIFRAMLANHPAFSAGQGIYGSGRLRTGDYLDIWLKNHTSGKKLEEKTAEWYNQAIRVHLKPALGHVPLARLSPQTIQDFYDSLLHKPISRGKPCKGKPLPKHPLSRTTVRHIANILDLAMDQAVKRGLVARNPVD